MLHTALSNLSLAADVWGCSLAQDRPCVAKLLLDSGLSLGFGVLSQHHTFAYVLMQHWCMAAWVLPGQERDCPVHL